SLTSFDNDGSYGGTSTIAFPADLGASKLAMSTSSQVSMDNTDNIVFRSLLTGIGDVTIDFNPGASTDNKDVAFGGLGYAWFFTKYDSDVFHHISNLPSGLKLTTTDGSKDATKYEQGIPSSS